MTTQDHPKAEKKRLPDAEEEAGATGGGTSGAAGGGCDPGGEEGVAAELAVAPAVVLPDAEGPELPAKQQNDIYIKTQIVSHAAHIGVPNEHNASA